LLFHEQGGILPTIRRFIETGLSGPVEWTEGPLYVFLAAGALFFVIVGRAMRATFS
jgi:hypothetical protein